MYRRTPAIGRFARMARVVAVAGLAGCKALGGDQSLPPGTTDPAIYKTAAGAVQEIAGTRALFRTALTAFVLASGTFTDELMHDGALDERILPEAADGAEGNDETRSYALVQNVRVQADLGIHALGAYAPTVPPALRGELYGIEGYGELMLADLFCSGIPLTTLDLGGRIIYRPGSPRDSVYRHAIALFDSAMAVSADSVRFMTLGRVGKGRALLALGEFDAAAQAVAAVADGDAYRLNVVIPASALDGAVSPQDLVGYSEGDHEGGNGLPYRSSEDPRTPFTQAYATAAGGSVNIVYNVPAKYLQGAVGDSASFAVADGIEARLIEAEAALRRNTTTGRAQWLSLLNHLRTVHGLDTLTDPGAALPEPAATAARVDTMFAERAAWLYLTGHRQGDMRRLLRQYNRIPSRVYPSGHYAGTFVNGTYGDAVTAPIPSSERLNPQFRGCLTRQP